MKSIKVTPAQMFTILENSNEKGFASVEYSKTLDENPLVSKVTISSARVGDEFARKLEIREQKQGLEKRELNEANYITSGTFGAIYKNDGAYAIRFSPNKNGTHSTFFYNGQSYTKNELKNLNILPDSFFEKKPLVDKRLNDENDFNWNVLKLINLDAITFGGQRYEIVAKQNDIKISELFKTFNKSKSAYLKSKGEATKQKHLAIMDEAKTEINFLKQGPNVEIINTRLELEKA